MGAAKIVELRAAQCRRVLKLIKDLDSDEKKLHEGMPKGVQMVLRGKRILLWKQLLEETGFPDLQIVDEVVEGLKLVGSATGSSLVHSLVVYILLSKRLNSCRNNRSGEGRAPLVSAVLQMMQMLTMNYGVSLFKKLNKAGFLGPMAQRRKFQKFSKLTIGYAPEDFHYDNRIRYV